MARWRENWADTRKRLTNELQRIGATSILITHAEDQRMDPGVAVWFSQTKEDFSWQQGLGLDNPASTLAEIDDDSKVADLHGYKRIDRSNPRTVIIVRTEQEQMF